MESSSGFGGLGCYPPLYAHTSCPRRTLFRRTSDAPCRVVEVIFLKIDCLPPYRWDTALWDPARKSRRQRGRPFSLPQNPGFAFVQGGRGPPVPPVWPPYLGRRGSSFVMASGFGSVPGFLPALSGACRQPFAEFPTAGRQGCRGPLCGNGAINRIVLPSSSRAITLFTCQGCK